MLRLLQRLIFGHVHTWTIIHESRFEWNGDFSEGTCTRYHLQCKDCGWVRVRDMR